MKKFIRGFVIGILLALVSTVASANVVSYSSGGSTYVYSEPSQTLIAISYAGTGYYILAPWDARLSAAVNSDITWAYNYAVANHLAFVWGQCYSSQLPPCLNKF